MPQFQTRGYSDYLVVVRPADWLRRRLVIPRLEMCVFPYLSGTDVDFRMTVKPKVKNMPLPEMSYTVYIQKKGESDWREFASQNHEASNSPICVILHLGHFSYSDEYAVELKIDINGKSIRQNIADIEFWSRANFEIGFVGLVLGAILGVLFSHLFGG